MRKKLASILAFIIAVTAIPLNIFAMPVETSSADSDITEGMCGDNLSFQYVVESYNPLTLTQYGRLVISGTGDMYDYDSETMSWRSYTRKVITGIELPDGMTSIGESVFSNLSDVESVTIPESVTKIGRYAFSNCHGLKSTNLPQNTVSLNGGIFYNCVSLNSINIPEALTTVSENSAVFHGCPLGDITFEGDRTVLPDKLFWGAGIKTVTLPSGLKEIGSSCFAGSDLTSIVIPDSVEKIGECAFNNCKSLTEVTLPESIDRLNGGTFYNCEKLNWVNIPEKLEKVSDTHSEFHDCPLKVVRFDGLRTVLPDYLFWGAGFEKLLIPDTVTEIGKNCFAQSALVKEVIPDSVVKIGERAFSGCKSLMSVTLPEDIDRLNGGTFYNCDKLDAINIPIKLTQVGQSTAEFWDCPLSVVEFEGDRKELPEKLFWGAAMQRINLPHNLETISKSCFAQCDDLVRIDLPESVRTIDENAFTNCNKLIYIRMPSTLDKMKQNTFKVSSGRDFDYDSNNDGKNDQLTTMLRMDGEPEHDYNWDKDNRHVVKMPKQYTPVEKTYDNITVNRKGAIHLKVKMTDNEGIPLMKNAVKYSFTEGIWHTVDTDRNGYIEVVSPVYEYNEVIAADNTRELKIGLSYYDHYTEEWVDSNDKYTIKFVVTPLSYSQKWTFDAGYDASGSLKSADALITPYSVSLGTGESHGVSIESRHHKGDDKVILGEDYAAKIKVGQSIKLGSVSMTMEELGVGIGMDIVKSSQSEKFGGKIQHSRTFTNANLNNSEYAKRLIESIVRAKALSTGDVLHINSILSLSSFDDWDKKTGEVYWRKSGSDTALDVSASLAGLSVGVFEAGDFTKDTTYSTTTTTSRDGGDTVRRARVVRSETGTLAAIPLINTSYAPYCSKSEFELVQATGADGEQLEIHSVENYTCDDATILGQYSSSQYDDRYFLSGADLDQACQELEELGAFRSGTGESGKKYVTDNAFAKIMGGIKDCTVPVRFIQTIKGGRARNLSPGVSLGFFDVIGVDISKELNSLETLEVERKNGILENGEEVVWVEMDIDSLVSAQKTTLDDMLGDAVTAVANDLLGVMNVFSGEKYIACDSVTAESDDYYLSVTTSKDGEDAVYNVAALDGEGNEYSVSTRGKAYEIRAYSDEACENEVESIGEKGVSISLSYKPEPDVTIQGAPDTTTHDVSEEIADRDITDTEELSGPVITDLELDGLGLYRFDADKSSYELVESSLDFRNNCVNATVKEPGQYILGIRETVPVTIVVGQKHAFTNDDFLTDETISKYTVSDKGIAKVTGKKLLGKKSGEVIVTAYKKVDNRHYEKVGRTLKVRVVKPVLARPTLTKVSEQIELSSLLDGNDVEATRWIVARSKVIKADTEAGTLEALKSGKVKVTAVFGTGKDAKKYSTRVTVKIPYLYPKTKKLSVGRSFNIKIKNTALACESYSSSDEAVATVDSTGKVTAVSKGNATITCIIDGVPYCCSVKVK